MFLPPSSSNRQPLPRHWVDALFKKLTARYGQLWIDRYGRVGLTMDELADEWGNELAGFTGAEIARGLDGCRTLKFPPTLPEFMMLCRPPIDAQVAFSEAIRNLSMRMRGEDAEWSHPALFWAAIDVGQFDMMNSGFPALKTRWEAALRHQLERTEIPAVPPAMKALPAPKTEVNHEAMALLRDLAAKMRSKS